MDNDPDYFFDNMHIMFESESVDNFKLLFGNLNSTSDDIIDNINKILTIHPNEKNNNEYLKKIMDFIKYDNTSKKIYGGNENISIEKIKIYIKNKINLISPKISQ